MLPPFCTSTVYLRLVPSHADMDRNARCPVLNGVGDQIRERLDDSMFVPLAGAIDIALECDLAVPRLRLELIDDLSADGPQVEIMRHAAIEIIAVHSLY